MTARVALVQLDVSDTEEPAARVDRAIGLVRDAAVEADVVVLPELWHVGAFDLARARTESQPIDGPLVSRLRTVAAQTSTWLHGGSFAELDPDGSRYNTAVLIDPDGRLVARYRKIHLFGFDDGEPTVMTAGRDVVVVDTPLGRTGIATCYDLRFPELYRALTAAGAETFLMCSGWPDRRIGHWDVLLRARAIEDQAWVVACNSAGTHNGVTMGGHSAVVDPRGDVVGIAGEAEEVLFVDIEPGAASSWRQAFPVLLDRVL